MDFFLTKKKPMVLLTQQNKELWRVLQCHVETPVEFTGLLLESCYRLLLINNWMVFHYYW